LVGDNLARSLAFLINLDLAVVAVYSILQLSTVKFHLINFCFEIYAGGMSLHTTEKKE